MSYCSFVLTPVTSLGCDGWHCSGWLGGEAGVQQINAVKIMQNIQFLSFTTWIQQFERYWLMASESSSTAPVSHFFLQLPALQHCHERQMCLQKQFHTETNSNAFILITKILLTGKQHSSTLLSLTNRASWHSFTQASRPKISICCRNQIHLLNQESQSWFDRGLSSLRQQENHSSGNNQSQLKGRKGTARESG